MKNKNLLSKNLDFFYRDMEPKREQIAKNEKMRPQIDLEFQQNEIKKLSKKTTSKCLAVVYTEKKHTLPNRKFGNSKNFFFGVNDSIKQLLLNFSIDTSGCRKYE